MNINKLKTSASSGLMRLVFLLVTAIVVIPIAWAIISSFKTSAEYLTDPWALPQSLQWQNYVNAFQKANMGDYLLNSVMITVGSMALLFIFGIPEAYALSRFRFVGSRLLNLAVLAGLFINTSYIVVPLFLQLKDMHALDNRAMLCVVYAAETLPFSIYLLSGFMKSISREYEEAARIDGCGYFSTMLRIVLPMCKPGIITVAMFNFMSYWNEYTLALTLLSTPEKRTLSVGLKNLMEMQRYATDWGAMFAGLVIVMLPTMIFYALVQNKLTSGITIGGIKG